ncbi:MAG: MATE family efflux transporter [Lentisphaeria bacterium]
MLRKPFNVLDHNIHPVAKILRLAWPVIVSMALHNSYSIIDMFWVASLGKEAVAGVTLSGILFFFMFSGSQVFASGIHALIARACGAGKAHQTGMILRDGMLIALLAGLIVGFILFRFPELALRFLGAEEEVVTVGKSYLTIMAVGFAVSLPQFTLSAGYRATGDMTTAMILTAVTVVLNLILDPILIFGLGPIPAFGLAGAAWATVISLITAVIVGIIILPRHHSLNGFRFYRRVSLGVVKEMFVIGLPTGVHYMLLSLNQTIMIRMVAEFGTVVIAATGIGTRITHLAFLPCIGIGTAIATLVGQYLGAGEEERAVLHIRRALLINGVVTLLFCVLIAVFPGVLMSVFTDSPDIVATGKVYLRVFALGFVFVSTVIVLTRVFQGAGDTVWPAVAAMCRILFFIVLGFILGWLTDLQELGVWLAFVVASFGQLLVISWIYRFGTWKRRSLKTVEQNE